ncbi:MAG: hypothetical protein ABII90_07710 [Bacteroidota bacterium]
MVNRETLKYYVTGTLHNVVKDDDREVVVDKIVTRIIDIKGDEEIYLKIVLGILLEKNVEYRSATAISGKIARMVLQNQEVK